ncbi:hypothetical protein Syun_017005 [Stephania yunnanensis]|uniref:Uncharacterized protein n=1 Tax=Stephania yunnanensis TaxID=152371 RepID=A0AAP0J8D4_9MAGN
MGTMPNKEIATSQTIIFSTNNGDSASHEKSSKTGNQGKERKKNSKTVKQTSKHVPKVDGPKEMRPNWLGWIIKAQRKMLKALQGPRRLYPKLVSLTSWKK